MILYIFIGRISDVNDSPPVFTQNGTYSVTLPEVRTYFLSSLYSIKKLLNANRKFDFFNDEIAKKLGNLRNIKWEDFNSGNVYV